MSGPTDIPRFGNAAPTGADGGVRNEPLRAAVEAFAAEPGAPAVIDVLRHCLHGPLLLDVTGSDITRVGDGQIAEGSTIAVSGGQGPDGKAALFAFTSHAELARMHPQDGTQVQSLVQAAADVLQMAKAQQAGWLYLDPAGPTCALAADDIDFAVRVPRNDAVRDALEPGTPREAQLAFTSGPEVVASCPDAQIATQDAADVLAAVRSGGHAGLVLNAAGPWVYVSAAELR